MISNVSNVGFKGRYMYANELKQGMDVNAQSIENQELCTEFRLMAVSNNDIIGNKENRTLYFMPVIKVKDYNPTKSYYVEAYKGETLH